LTSLGRYFLSVTLLQKLSKFLFEIQIWEFLSDKMVHLHVICLPRFNTPSPSARGLPLKMHRFERISVRVFICAGRATFVRWLFLVRRIFGLQMRFIWMKLTAKRVETVSDQKPPPSPQDGFVKKSSR
jgi:hypothetical protein